MTAAVPDDRPQDLLRRIPILSGLSEEMGAEIAAAVERVELRAGEWLFKEGEPGDSLYLICSGRLEAVSRAASAEVIRVLGRGESIGELALLTGSPRSASVRARRDSRLLRLDRERFAALLGDAGFARSLLHNLGTRLQASRSLPSSGPTTPQVVAVAGLGGKPPVRRVAEELRTRLERWGTVALLDREGVVEATAAGPRRPAYAELLDQLERAHDRVLLMVDDISSTETWAAFARDQVDRVLVVATCRGRPPRADLPRGCDLVLHGGRSLAGDPGPWLAALRPRATYRLTTGGGFADALDRLARRLSGRSVGVVLSGGGARGFAHIGALEALQASGVQIDRVGGTSMGAIVGGLFASGLSPDRIREVCKEEFVRRNPLSDYTLPIAALMRRRKAEAMLGRMFGSRLIEDLPLAFFCVSSDLVGGELVVHREGPIARAAGASSCLPGILPPLPRDGRLLVDGGVLNNLPVEIMAAAQEGPVIAVDVTARFRSPVRTSAGRPGVQRLAARFRDTVVGEATPLPTLKETLIRTVALGSVDTTAAAREHADLLIEPAVERYGLAEFEELDPIVAAGREATLRVLEQQSDWVRALGAMP